MKRKDNEFYKRMIEAKAKKKQKLEQEQLQAEFTAYPERFSQPVVVKSEVEQKVEGAFSDLKAKLTQERLAQQDALMAAIKKISDQSQGL